MRKPIQDLTTLNQTQVLQTTRLQEERTRLYNEQIQHLKNQQKQNDILVDRLNVNAVSYQQQLYAVNRNIAPAFWQLLSLCLLVS